MPSPDFHTPHHQAAPSTFRWPGPRRTHWTRVSGGSAWGPVFLSGPPGVSHVCPGVGTLGALCSGSWLAWHVSACKNKPCLQDGGRTACSSYRPHVSVFAFRGRCLSSGPRKKTQQTAVESRDLTRGTGLPSRPRLSLYPGIKLSEEQTQVQRVRATSNMTTTRSRITDKVTSPVFLLAAPSFRQAT